MYGKMSVCLSTCVLIKPVKMVSQHTTAHERRDCKPTPSPQVLFVVTTIEQ